MGPPLGPSLANAFLSYHEKNWFLNSSQQGFKPVFYWRYVDNIFILFKLNDYVKYLQEFLNSCHISMSFSMETERQNKFSFLDIEVIREQGKFSIAIYRKPTLLECIVHSKVFYFLFTNLAWYTSWFTDVFVFARIRKNSMQKTFLK